MFYSISFLIFLFQLFLLIFGKNEYIYINYDRYENYLSTKTPYRFIENKNYSKIEFEGCIANRMWSVIRHGTRTPGSETEFFMRSRLIEIQDLIRKFNQKSVKNVFNLNNFNKWKPHTELDNKKRLTFIGKEEMINLAEKLGERFSSILPKQWNNSTYKFQFTDTSRTRASAEYFVSGLFGKKKAQQVWFPEPLKKNRILRFYKCCDKWRKNVKKNPKTLIELNKFLYSDIFTSLINNVTERFGLPHGILNISDIQLIYTTCCFETAWDKFKSSPWCSIFTIEEFRILEYAEDIEYYWVDGYGYDLTTKIGCVMLRDVINHLKIENMPKAVFYFTHSGTILKFLTHLGLYKDSDSLRHDNYHKHIERLWKTSKIDSFASNIAFVLYNCFNEKYVLTLHQERPVILPGCPNHTYLCSLKRIEQIYENSLKSCNLDNLCFVDDLKSHFTSVIDRLWKIFESWKLRYYL